MLQNQLPHHRLEAGAFGMMEVGLGFASASSTVAKDRNPGQWVIWVEEDGAFGFSSMEMGTV